MSFADNLRLLRKNNGYTQKELCTELGVALSTVAMWETGNRQPDLDTAKKIAEFFKVSVDELLRDAGELDDKYLPEKDLSARITPKMKVINEDLADIRELLRTRPEVKMLFSVSKNASKADIERAVTIIEALKSKSDGRRD